MLINEFSKPITVKSLNENLAKKYGKTINVDKFTTEQLEDARNRIRTTLSQVETNESFDAVHTSETYQKNKLFLELLNTAIAEREAIEEKQSPAQKAAFQKMMAKKGKGKSKDKKAGKGKKPDDDGDGVPDWADKKPGEDDHAKNEGIQTYKTKSGYLAAVGDARSKGADSVAGAAKPKGAQAATPKGAQAAGGKVAGKVGGISAAEPKKLNASKKSKVREGAEEQSALVMASKDMVDRITGWMEDTAEMQTESMLELGDKIRDEMGIDKSEEFINTVKPALGSLFTSLESTRDSLTGGVAILTGEGAPSTMGDEVPADDMDMEPTVDADAEAEAPEGDDEFAAADASVGGDEPDDRGKRESIELSKRLGLLLADSKKKD